MQTQSTLCFGWLKNTTNPKTKPKTKERSFQKNFTRGELNFFLMRLHYGYLVEGARSIATGKQLIHSPSPFPRRKVRINKVPILWDALWLNSVNCGPFGNQLRFLPPLRGPADYTFYRCRLRTKVFNIRICMLFCSICCRLLKIEVFRIFIFGSVIKFTNESVD